MVFPISKANGGNLPTDIGPTDLSTVLKNSATPLGGGGAGGGLLIFNAKERFWTFNRNRLVTEDVGLLIADFMQIAAGIVEWAANRPLQTKFATLASGKVVTEADLDKPLSPQLYRRGTNDGPQATVQVIGAFIDNGAGFRFETGTKGGVGAVEALRDAALSASSARNEIMHPVFELSSGSYQHPQYGTTFIPEFRVVGFVPKKVTDERRPTEEDIVTEIETPAKATKTNGKKARGGAI